MSESVAMEIYLNGPKELPDVWAGQGTQGAQNNKKGTK
ncbi:hypothetical protein FOYG_06150 [Fusarium oxysporum NRRL 32931]|uniref:Uncharacterized protein n=1 Tax=Fusarium oxysporum NRRL 32931 TaxID=660029 RepID=W9ICI1_FUSOX|nr:hypothetical protein FOYG_06150 [Fusarium oxysporum NRRL 32931]